MACPRCLFQSSQWPIRYLPLAPVEPVPSDIEIARAQTPKDVIELAREVGILESEVCVRACVCLSTVCTIATGVLKCQVHAC